MDFFLSKPIKKSRIATALGKLIPQLLRKNQNT